MVSFKSPIFKLAHEAISGAGGAGALGLDLRASGSLSGIIGGGSDAGACCSGAPLAGALTDALSVDEGVNAVHEARKKAATRNLMTSSLGATGR